MQVILRPQAIEDLERILEPVLSRIFHKIRLLAEFPLLGPPMDGPFLGYRFLTIEPFRVVHRPLSGDFIEVLYIRHCKRQSA